MSWQCVYVCVRVCVWVGGGGGGLGVEVVVVGGGWGRSFVEANHLNVPNLQAMGLEQLSTLKVTLQ